MKRNPKYPGLNSRLRFLVLASLAKGKGNIRNSIQPYLLENLGIEIETSYIHALCFDLINAGLVIRAGNAFFDGKKYQTFELTDEGKNSLPLFKDQISHTDLMQFPKFRDKVEDKKKTRKLKVSKNADFLIAKGNLSELLDNYLQMERQELTIKQKKLETLELLLSHLRQREETA